MTEKQSKARKEFSASLDSNRSEVRARRNAVRQESGKAVSPKRMKFLREVAVEQRRHKAA